MTRFDVYVRAIDLAGRWWSAPVTALDEDSFRRFVADRMARTGMVTGVVSDEELPLRTTIERPDE